MHRYFPNSMTRWQTGMLTNHKCSIPESPHRCGDMHLVPDLIQLEHIRRHRLIGRTSRTPTTTLRKMWTSIAGMLYGEIGKGRDLSFYNYHFAIPDL